MLGIALLIFLTFAQTPFETQDDFTKAITAGNVQGVKDELALGSNWKSKTKDGMPALILAAESGQDQIIRILLNDPIQKSLYTLGSPLTDGHHRTALIAAASGGHRSSVLELLYISTEDLSLKVTPVVCRSAEDRQFEPSQIAIGDLIAATAARNALLDAADENAVTALMIAAQQGWQDVVDSMLKSGADPLARDKNGLSASDYAENAGHASLAESLRLAKQK